MTVPSPESDADPETRQRKTRLRAAYRERRQALGDERRARFDAAIRSHLLDAAVFLRARRVGAFVAFDGERPRGPNPVLDLVVSRQPGDVVRLSVERRTDSLAVFLIDNEGDRVAGIDLT